MDDRLLMQLVLVAMLAARRAPAPEPEPMTDREAQMRLQGAKLDSIAGLSRGVIPVERRLVVTQVEAEPPGREPDEFDKDHQSSQDIEYRAAAGEAVRRSLTADKPPPPDPDHWPCRVQYGQCPEGVVFTTEHGSFTLPLVTQEDADALNAKICELVRPQLLRQPARGSC